MHRIGDYVSAMGQSVEDVVKTLRESNVRGLRDSTSYLSPLVRYLNQNYDLGARLEVGAKGAVLRAVHEGRVEEIPLPHPVQQFLQAFHDGAFPDLELK